MKLKTKPSKPSRNRYTDSQEIVKIFDESDMPSNLNDFINELQNITIRYTNCTISINKDYDGCFYEGDSPSFEVQVRATIYGKDKYAEAVDKYNKKIADYTKWFEANKDAIEKELMQRALKQELAKQEKVQKLEKELEKLKK